MYWIVPLVALGFVAFWALLLWLIGTLGGWGKLAAHYRYWGTFDGAPIRGQSAAIGWSNYGGVLTFGADSRGLHIAVFPLFQFGHPPLFIPWADIAAKHFRRRWSSGAQLHFSKAPKLAVEISNALAEKIRLAAPPTFAAT